MRKKKFTKIQVVAILKESEAGAPVADVCLEHAISSPTYYAWKSKYAGATVSDLTRMRELQTENARFKHMDADLALENAAIQDVLSKILTPSVKRQAVEVMVTQHHLSIMRACNATGLSRPAECKVPLLRQQKDAEVTDGLNGIVERTGSWGFWK